MCACALKSYNLRDFDASNPSNARQKETGLQGAREFELPISGNFASAEVRGFLLLYLEDIFTYKFI
jgi:hypothetical protein